MAWGFKEAVYAEGVWITVSRTEHEEDFPISPRVVVLSAKKPGPLAAFFGSTFESRLLLTRQKAKRLCRLNERLDEEHAARVRDTRARVKALDGKR